MADTPTVGGDKNTWGTKLNAYLGVAHETSGADGGKVKSDAIMNVPEGSISATTNQAAINEIVADNAASGGSSLIGYLPFPGTVVSTAQVQLRKIVRISDFTSNSLNTAVTAIGATPTTLYIDAAATCTGPLTIPTTISILCTREGSIYIASGILTINGSFEAGLYQAFSGSGTVVFGDGSVPMVVPQWWGAVGDGITDSTTAIQKAITTDFLVFFPRGTYMISASLTPPASTIIKMEGFFYRNTVIRALPGFTGYMIQADGTYYLKNLTFTGIADTEGIYAIGSNTPGKSGASVLLDKVSFFFFDISINFGPEYEHPVGLYYNDLWIEYFVNGGINLGGLTGAASSGESNFVFGRITITNGGATRTEYGSSVQVNTPSTSYDRITWSGTVPPYGFVVMRSADNATNWHVPPNWLTIYGFTATTYDASKDVGETWYYKVVRNTVGLSVRRAKSISGASIQSEYSGVGQLYIEVKGCVINSIYYENRDEAIPPPMICAVAAAQTDTLVINGGWVDRASYGIIVTNNSTVEYKNVRHADIYWAAIGKANTATATNVRYSGLTGVTTYTKAIAASAYDYNNSATEYSAAEFVEKLSHTTQVKKVLQYRGVEKSSWYYNSDEGAIFTGINKVNLTPLAKANMTPGTTNIALATTLADKVSTLVLTIPVENNRIMSLQYAYNIVVMPATVSRQGGGGILTITIVNMPTNSLTVAVAVAGEAKALQTGTLSITFTASSSGGNALIYCTSDSSTAADASLYLVPLCLGGNASVPVVVQS